MKRRPGTLFAAYALFATVGLSTLLITRARASQDIPPETVSVLAWQGLLYGSWLPILVLAHAVARRLDLSAGAAGLLALGGLVAVPAHALLAAVLERRFTARAEVGTVASLMFERVPLEVLIYTALAAGAWAAAAHARTAQLKGALATARVAAVAPQPGEPERLLVATGSARVPVAVDDVEWFGAAGNYLVVNWAGREGLVRRTLKDLEAGLDPTRFARVHRSTLVNLARVARASALADGSWRLEMESGAQLVASRTHRDAVLARLGRR